MHYPGSLDGSFRFPDKFAEQLKPFSQCLSVIHSERANVCIRAASVALEAVESRLKACPYGRSVCLLGDFHPFFNWRPACMGRYEGEVHQGRGIPDTPRASSRARCRLRNSIRCGGESWHPYSSVQRRRVDGAACDTQALITPPPNLAFSRSINARSFGSRRAGSTNRQLRS